MSNGERNGFKSYAVAAAAVVALALGIFASAKDTPTREEMERKDDAVETRLSYQMARIEALTRDNRAMLLELLREKRGQE